MTDVLIDRFGKKLTLLTFKCDRRTDLMDINVDVSIEVQERTDGIYFMYSDVMDVQI